MISLDLGGGGSAVIRTQGPTAPSLESGRVSGAKLRGRIAVWWVKARRMWRQRKGRGVGLRGPGVHA